VALQLTQVSYTYGQDTRFAQPALHEVDLSAEVGRLALVAGPTGSGKSTLLRMAAGLIPVQAGKVEVDGHAGGDRVGAPGGIGLVFQSPETQLFAETVLEDVAFGPRQQGVGEAEAEQIARGALTRVGLPPAQFAARSPFSLSGGEARRAALAGTLALRSRYVLLDEPTAGLDAQGRAAVLSLIDDLRTDGGVVVVSHDLDAFLGRADDALLLREGRTAYYGPAEELVQDPRVLSDAGLGIPEVLRIQLAARERGVLSGALTMDPDEAARSILAGGGWPA